MEMSGMKDSPVQSGLDIAGSLMTAYGKSAEGDAAALVGQRKLAYAAYEAQQLRVNAGQQIAVAQQNAQYQRLQTDYIVSRARAVAAAGGGNTSDPGVVSLIAGIEKEGAYRASAALYAGKEAARGDINQANATLYGGQLASADAQSARNAARFGAVTSLIKSGASLYDKYANVGPSSVGNN
jgi:hypothetical protein